MRDDQGFLDAEIDLNDYLDIILKNKIVMLCVFLLIFITGSLINLLSPSVRYYQVTAIYENCRAEFIPGPWPWSSWQTYTKEVMNLAATNVILRSAPFINDLFKNTNAKISPEEFQRTMLKDVQLTKIFDTYFYKLEVNSKDKKAGFVVAQEILKKLEPITNNATMSYISNYHYGNHVIKKFSIIDPPVLPEHVAKVVPNKKLRTILLFLMAVFFTIWAPFIAEFFYRRKHRRVKLTD